jgi:hypothetical protein
MRAKFNVPGTRALKEPDILKFTCEPLKVAFLCEKAHPALFVGPGAP